MFYCDKCAAELGWPHGFPYPQSRGPCEICEKSAICTDYPSASLPQPKSVADIKAAEPKINAPNPRSLAERLWHERDEARAERDALLANRARIEAYEHEMWLLLNRCAAEFDRMTNPDNRPEVLGAPPDFKLMQDVYQYYATMTGDWDNNILAPPEEE